MPSENLVAAVFAVLLVAGLQAYATVAVFRRLRSARLSLQQSRRDQEFLPAADEASDSPIVNQSSSTTNSESLLPSPAFEWIDWIENRVRVARVRGEPVTREAALSELDQILAGDREYVLLQRIGVVAPLVGVLVTAVAFFTFRVPTHAPDSSPPQVVAQDSSDATAFGSSSQVLAPTSQNAARRAAAGEAILGTIRPLATGVFVGAFLAIINQGLLFFLGNQSIVLRRYAREWLDRRQEFRGDLIDAATAGALMSKSYEAVARIHSTANQHQDFAQGLQGAIRQLTDATAGIKHGALLMRQEVTDLQPVVQQFRDAALALNTTLQIVGPKTQSTATGLDRLVAQLNTAIDLRLIPAIEQQTRFSNVFGDLLRHVDQCSSQLQSVAGTVIDAKKLSEETFDKFRSSWDQHVIPAQQSFRQGAEQMQEASQSLAGRIDHLAETVGRITERIGGLDDQLAAPVSSLSDAAQTIQAAVRDHLATTIQSQRVAAEQWHLAAEEMRVGAGQWRQSVSEAMEANSLHSASCQMLDNAVRSTFLPTSKSFEESVDKLRSASYLLSENIARSSEVLTDSAAAIKGVPEATSESLGELRASVSEFASAVRGDFSGASRDYATSVESIKQSLVAALENSRELSAATQHQRTLIASQAKVFDASEQVLVAIHQATGELRQGVDELNQSIRSQLLPFHSQLASSSRDFQENAAQLSGILRDTMRPAADQLAGLQGLIDQLRVTLASLRPLADLRVPLGNLNSVVSQLAQTISLLNALPDKLDEKSRASADRRTWLNWFRRKPNKEVLRNPPPPPPPPPVA
jgi:hypothetical protein